MENINLKQFFSSELNYIKNDEVRFLIITFFFEIL